jgi:hypothetical protein
LVVQPNDERLNLIILPMILQKEVENKRILSIPEGTKKKTPASL